MASDSCVLKILESSFPKKKPCYNTNHITGRNAMVSNWPYGLELERRGFFIFFIFYFCFLQKYIFIFEIYRNIPRPPSCRAAGIYLQKLSRKNYAPVPGGLVARQRAAGMGGHSGYPKISGRVFRVLRISGFQNCYPKFA